MGYWMRPRFDRWPDGGQLLLGPIQFNWGHGNKTGPEVMPKGLRVHLTWPGRIRSLFLG